MPSSTQLMATARRTFLDRDLRYLRFPLVCFGFRKLSSMDALLSFLSDPDCQHMQARHALICRIPGRSVHFSDSGIPETGSAFRLSVTLHRTEGNTVIPDIKIIAQLGVQPQERICPCDRIAAASIRFRKRYRHLHRK